MKCNSIIICQTVLATFFLAVACIPRQSDYQEDQVQQAVATTISTIPTYTPFQKPSQIFTYTAVPLSGLFCEYQFCIGHPSIIAFFDVSTQTNPAAPSSFDQGLLVAYNTNIIIEMLWQHAPGISDQSFMLDLILNPDADTLIGNMDVNLINNMNVLYTNISTTATSVLPHGGAAAWICE
ncbi:MAG: hypothetical protein QGD96_01105 [Anaerolineae bacterium]|nr:hypothetical protein [Anaerolineae bacterium]